MRRLLLSVFVTLVISGAACAEVDLNSATKQDSAKPTEEVRIVQPVKNWYAGGAVGLAYLTGWNTSSVSNYYEKSYGYYDDTQTPHGWLWAGITELFQKVAFEGKIYGGYRAFDFMDVELGFASDYGWNPTNDYKNNLGDTVESSRKIKSQALYISTSFRPLPEGHGHGLYFKFGGHSSQLNISKTVTGTPANLNTIAAGDNLPRDGTSRGYGSLYGIGFDFKTAKTGAVRLEWSHYNKLGGTDYGKSSLNIGYQGNF